MEVGIEHTVDIILQVSDFTGGQQPRPADHQRIDNTEQNAPDGGYKGGGGPGNQIADIAAQHFLMAEFTGTQRLETEQQSDKGSQHSESGEHRRDHKS